MEELLMFILKNLVNHPDDLNVVPTESPYGENSQIYLIEANEEDKGLIIGRHGNTINAIRDIAKIRAIGEGKKVYLKIE